uniref:AIG1-type G domain-containing protein n=1 Tax=Sinocyclocheilus rhinocerous TaxID=307959 RepID=A0A673HQG6_9TELE
MFRYLTAVRNCAIGKRGLTLTVFLHHCVQHLLTGDVRIVLLGKTGVGKKAFKSILTSRSVKETSEFNKRWITVIDTPGLYDSGVDKVEIRKEIVMCISMEAPGPHVFLLTVKMIHETFGDKSRMYTMVLFTRGDQLRGRRIPDLIEDDKSLKSLIQQCGHRYHVYVMLVVFTIK